MSIPVTTVTIPIPRQRYVDLLGAGGGVDSALDAGRPAQTFLFLLNWDLELSKNKQHWTVLVSMSISFNLFHQIWPDTIIISSRTRCLLLCCIITNHNGYHFHEVVPLTYVAPLGHKHNNLYAQAFMTMSSNGNMFRATGPLCTGEFPAQRPVTRSFGVFFDLRLNLRLSKQSWGWLFETPSCSLWRHYNVYSHTLPLIACDFPHINWGNVQYTWKFILIQLLATQKPTKKLLRAHLSWSTWWHWRYPLICHQHMIKIRSEFTILRPVSICIKTRLRIVTSVRMFTKK